MEKRTHRQTAAVLLVSCYIAAMLFFAVVRAFGLLWFRQEYVHTSVPLWAGNALLYAFWVLDGIILLRTLTPLSWAKSTIIMSLAKSAAKDSAKA